MDQIIRPVQREDRDKIVNLLHKIRSFSQQHIELALELIDVYLDRPEQKDYIVNCLYEKSLLVGFICFGPTPLTQRTFDLYWIAVDPDQSGKGHATKMLLDMEEKIKSSAGRMILIETSSQKSYENSRQFYMRRGYIESERIKDFYRVGEDRITFIKHIDR